MRKAIIVAAMALLAVSCRESVHQFALAEPFCDGMVLPKGKDIKVFGVGDGVVKVEMNGKKARCRAKNGSWCTGIPAMDAGGPYVMTVRSKGYEVQVGDVYVGTVLLLGGQSNMEFKMRDGITPIEEWTGDPLIRSFSLPKTRNDDPYSPADGWVKCCEDNVGSFSAIGYLAAKELRSRNPEAVGLVNCYQGASVIESWMPAELAQKPEYQLPDNQRHGDHFHQIWKAWNGPGFLYELDIVPFAPYPVSAVAWYQGESNTGLGEYKIYPSMFADMASSWRSAFQDEKLPFVVVEIADYVLKGPAWPDLQKAQETIPELVPNTVVVRSADVCEDCTIHPRDKKALSVRIVDALEEFNL